MRAYLFASATTAFCHPDFSLSWYAQLEIGSSCRCAFITAYLVDHHGRSAEGVTLSCAGQPKRIREVRTGRSALGQPYTLRGRLGLRRMVPVWGGADATPDRAIGQFADANWVSIPWRCGS